MALGALCGDDADVRAIRRRQPTHRILSEVDGGARISSASRPTPTAWRERGAVAEAVPPAGKNATKCPRWVIVFSGEAVLLNDICRSSLFLSEGIQ